MSYETRKTSELLERVDWQEVITAALDTPGNVGNVYSRFYDYSYLNQILLRMQGATGPVATYRKWQELGRQVKKGSKAKVILRPVIVSVENEEGEKEQRVVGFKPSRSLFELSQTVGKELPPPPPLPGWDLASALGKLGIRETAFDELNGNVQGFSRGLEFAINPLAVHPHKTRFHEIGHIVLGHTLPMQHEEYRTHRGLKEFEAESTAYLSMHELGQLDDTAATQSRGYIQSWLAGERPPDESIKNVFKATDAILRAGRIATAGTLEPPA